MAVPVNDKVLGFRGILGNIPSISTVDRMILRTPVSNWD